MNLLKMTIKLRNLIWYKMNKIKINKVFNKCDNIIYEYKENK